MGLAKMQEVLVKLYTDATLRAEFLADPDGTSKALGLTETEADQLTSVPAKQIEFFADSLHRKRSVEVRSLLPYTCRALGESFESLFAIHADQFCPQGHHKHQNDAIQFATFLSHHKHNQHGAGYVIDIARFESALLRAHQFHKRFFVRLFKHDVKQLIHEIDEGSQITSQTFRPSISIWIRIGSMKRLYFVTVPQWSR